MVLFQHAKQSEHGPRNPIVARLMVQSLEILRQCDIAKEKREKIENIYINSLSKKLLRCWEIEERLRAESDKALASYKPPTRGAVSVECPQVSRLEEECHTFLHEARNFLNDLLQVFNLLHGTNFDEVGDWVHAKKGKQAVTDFASAKFGENHMNTRFFRQMPTCIAPYVYMRNAVDHPKRFSGELKVENLKFDAVGKLADPVWSRVKDGDTEYGPLTIVRDMHVGVQNILILAEDVLIMWALDHLSTSGLTEITSVPESRRDPNCPTKYRIIPSAAVLSDIARREAAKGEQVR
jgi:hypothetical protein